MKKLLYTSGDVRKSVIELFGDSTRHRVAVTAFVGSGAEAYLPNPKGLQLYCWPKAGGTDPDVLRKLIKRGAEVFFVDGLHMKVYWSEDKGAVVTSANLSTNALGSGNLKEIGVLLGPKEIDIDRIIQSLKIRSVSSKELKKLDLYHKQYVARNRGEGRRGFRMRSYLEWYKEPSRPEWKLGVVEGTVELASNAKAKSKNRYGVEHPEDWISCSYGEYKEGDWILTFKLRKSPTGLKWMFADFIMKVSRSDKKAYNQEYPYQAVQVWKKKNYPAPPFSAHGKRFQRAFREAVTEFGPQQIMELESSKPPKRLVDLIRKHF